MAKYYHLFTSRERIQYSLESGFRIRCQGNLDSGFVKLYYGLQSLSLLIPQVKIFRILKSGSSYMGLIFTDLRTIAGLQSGRKWRSQSSKSVPRKLYSSAYPGLSVILGDLIWSKCKISFHRLNVHYSLIISEFSSSCVHTCEDACPTIPWITCCASTTVRSWCVSTHGIDVTAVWVWRTLVCIW